MVEKQKTEKKMKFVETPSTLYIFLKNKRLIDLGPKNKNVWTSDLFLEFLKESLKIMKEKDRERVVACLDIVELQFFAGINKTILNELDVPFTAFKIGQVLLNKSGEVRLIDSIVRAGGKNGDLKYGWINPHNQMASACGEQTLIKWLES